MTTQGQEQPHGYVIRIVAPPNGGWVHRHGAVDDLRNALRFTTALSASHWLSHHVETRYLRCEIWSYRVALESHL